LVKHKKTPIAIIIPGGIGTGQNNIGVPVLERLVKLLSRDFQISVFSLLKVNDDYKPVGFELIDVHSDNPLIRILKFLFVFWRMQRHRKFEALHGFWALPSGFLAVLAGKIYNIRSIVSLQGGDAISLPEINYGQLQKWLPRKIALWTLQEVNELLSPTRYLIKNLEGFGLQRDHVKYIPLGIDVNLFKFQDKDLRHPVHFLHIANLNPVKDQTTLLKTFQILYNRIPCHLTIIGEGELEVQVKSLADTLNLSRGITFLKPAPYESLTTLYAQADILLHTSLSEGHPIVVEEAMSCGVVVCGTKVGLLYDLPDCFISVDVRDHKSLASETLQLIADPERMKTLRQRAHRWALEHSIDWTVEKIKDIYTLKRASLPD
jgi:glycosyltransferase involved in cell wall biosynthesis